MYQIIMNENTLFFDNVSDIIELIKKESTNIFYKIINNNKIMINNILVCNTKFICHRINKSEELKNINNNFGIEIDLRDDHKSNKIILAHDPFVDGEDFENYLINYNHNLLVLNIKSERIEIECIQLMNKYNIKNYFFIDSTFPMINLLNKKYSNKKFASRYSEYECIEFTENIKDMIEWIWIDCFTYLPLYKNIF
jgi:hypothetical protein